MAGTATPRKRATKKPAEQAVESVDIDAQLSELEQMSGHEVVNEDGSINPIQIGKRGRTPNQQVKLFELGGRDYFVPEKPSPALMQRFMRDVRKKGSAVAAAALLDTLIGEEALDALAESPDVTEEDMAAIYTAVTHLAFGRFAKKGKQPSDPS